MHAAVKEYFARGRHLHSFVVLIFLKSYRQSSAALYGTTLRIAISPLISYIALFLKKFPLLERFSAENI